MHVLRIEHSVLDYDAWKEAFDGDPIGRERSSVRRYRILRAADDPNYVMIDLEFDGASEAETAHAALRELWSRVDVMRSPASADRRGRGEQGVLTVGRRIPNFAVRAAD